MTEQGREFVLQLCSELEDDNAPFDIKKADHCIVGDEVALDEIILSPEHYGLTKEDVDALFFENKDRDGENNSTNKEYHLKRVREYCGVVDEDDGLKPEPLLEEECLYRRHN
jgi:hypothetical protein